jgi:hypothetical protein
MVRPADPPPSQLVVHPTSLAAQLPVGARELQHLFLGNAGISATLNYTIGLFPTKQEAGIVEWLDVTPTQGAIQPGLQVTVAVTFIPQLGMLPGDLYQASVLVLSDGQTEPVSVTVPALLIVTEVPLTVQPDFLSVELLAGGTASRTVTLQNDSKGPLAVTTTVHYSDRVVIDPWLAVSPATSTIPVGQSQVLTVTFDTGLETLGLHTAGLIVESKGTVRFVVTMPVDMRILPWLAYLPVVLREP